jgi:hypothetical protein
MKDEVKAELHYLHPSSFRLPLVADVGRII